MRVARCFTAALSSAVLLSTSCGPKSKPVVQPIKKQLDPNDIKAATDAPDQAAILGTDANGGSTIIPLSERETTVSVDSMWVKLGPPASGGSSPVNLTIAPNPDGKVRVGMYEEFSGGLGPQWRAGVWLSAFLASTTINKDLTDFKFTAEAGGNVDGASASGLMTAGYLAALTDVAIDPLATMTGIINPDGTIGPVGGIPHKFAGSIEKGKKKLGYPIGMRFMQDMNTGENVDLVKLARDGGAEAVEVSDIYGAYELMTGKKLARQVPVEEREMELEDDVISAFETAYTTWQKKVAEEWDRIIELDQHGRLPQGLINLALEARREVEVAEKQHQQGFAPSAYKHIVDAWIYAAAATSTSEILELVTAGDLVGAKARLLEFESLADQTEPVLRKIAEMRPDTMGGHMQMLSAYQKGVAGMAALMQFGNTGEYTRSFLDGLEMLPPEQLAEWEITEQTVSMTAPTVLAVARSVANSAVAHESIAIEGTKDISYMCSLPNVRRLAASYQSAAAANVTYFETLLGVTDDYTRNRVASMEPDYLTAYIASLLSKLSGMPDTLKKEWGEESLPWGLLTLASSQLAYFKASTLISRYYSLSVQNDWMTGLPTSVQHEKAFMNMLTSAETKARENARGAKVATGTIPVQARIAYQNARVLREGDLADKLNALEMFWQSSAYSQTAVMLARN